MKVGWLISAFFPQLNRITPEQKKRIPDTRVLMVSFIADEYGQRDKMLSIFCRFVDVCRVLNESGIYPTGHFLSVNNIERARDNLI